MKSYLTRMGDGTTLEMTEEEIRDDIEDGVATAAKKAKVDPLSQAEKDRLFEIITMPGDIVSVEARKRVVSTADSGADPFARECGIPIKRSVEALLHERAICSDSYDLGFTEYTYKAVKPIVRYEAQEMRIAQQNNVMPILYGAMPNMGMYTQPDGPFENWSELLPAGEVDRARQAQEGAVINCVDDIVAVASAMFDAGADGINLDTSGASGDADFLAALKSCEEIRNKYPTMGVMMGMAGEFVLGMHGLLDYKGTKLAGLYPHKQVKLAEQAGATIFGCAINTDCNESFAWNIAKVVTMVKRCVADAEIPVHVNAGMGVGGIPMCEYLPIDSVSRADMAMIELANIDGL